MASIPFSFHQLKPSMKAILVLSLCASVASVVFGGVRLASDRWKKVSDIVSGKRDGSQHSTNGLDIFPNRDIDGTAIKPSTGSPSPSRLEPPPTLSPTKTYLRSMIASYPPFTSTSTSSLPSLNHNILSSAPSDAAVSDVPTKSDAFDDYLHPVGTKQPSNLPAFTQSTVWPTTLLPAVPIGGEQFESTSLQSAKPSQTDDGLASLSFSPSSEQPSITPLFPVHTDPMVNATQTFFNYNTTQGSQFGPSSWGNVIVSNSTSENYWIEFGFVANQCSDKNVTQSPIDVCTSPEKHCLEYHEPRAKGGNFMLTDQFITKQIFPNKLHLRVTRKVINQTIPPSFDFASTGAKSLDLLNIDIKFPSEHTVCGRRFDGEMQYYFFHPVKLNFIVVAWLFEVNVGNPDNEHLQRLIDEFQEIYDFNLEICRQRSVYESVMSAINHTNMLNGHRKLPDLESRWNPFHRDIQKTIHFWGYTGSLTEPPCAGETMWRIMDVPVQISVDQLNQMQNILFNNRDSGTCAFTSRHYKGSVARPINDPLPYYKCTRQDYKSDDERELCGDDGCVFPFSTHLDPYVEPIVHVTAPPSMAPSIVLGDGQI